MCLGEYSDNKIPSPALLVLLGSQKKSFVRSILLSTLVANLCNVISPQSLLAYYNYLLSASLNLSFVSI